MKKLILCASLIAGLTFVACADDEEDVPIPVYVGCTICEIPETAASEVEEQPYEVCIDADGIAYVDNAYTGIEGSYYFELYCANEYDIEVGTTSEFADDAVGTCRTCDAYDVMGEEQPAENVCKGDNGNAIVDGEDTGINYVTYLTMAELATECN
jgi:hypothetical protein